MSPFLHRTHKDHTLHCLLQAAQMAAEGPPPPGVSRNSLDSAFGGAQRALQLSALSMPERIAYMQVRASGSRVQIPDNLHCSSRCCPRLCASPTCSVRVYVAQNSARVVLQGLL